MSGMHAKAELSIANGDFNNASILPDTASSDNDNVAFGSIVTDGWWVPRNGHKWMIAYPGDSVYENPPDGTAYARTSSTDANRTRGMIQVIHDAGQTEDEIVLAFDLLYRGGNFGMKIYGINGDWDGEFELMGRGGTWDWLFSDPGAGLGAGLRYTGSADELGVFASDDPDSEADEPFFIPDSNNWQEIVVSFDAGNGYDWIVIGFVQNGLFADNDPDGLGNSPSGRNDFGIDNLREVPEPGLFCVMCILAGLFRFKQMV